MRRIARLYSTAACLFLGATITALLFVAIAARLAPESLEGAGGSLARAIARISGSVDSRAPSGDAPAAPAPAPAPRDPPAPAVPVAFGNGGDGGIARAIERAARGRRESEAWRAVEVSLARLFEALGVEEESCRPGYGAGIVDAAPRIIERMERLTREQRERKKTLVESLEPRALARVLMDEASISDARAEEILAGIGQAARAEVIDRLSRLAPRRAARLLDRALGGEAARGPSGARSGKG
jgi:hypothetical protein